MGGGDTEGRGMYYMRMGRSLVWLRRQAGRLVGKDAVQTTQEGWECLHRRLSRQHCELPGALSQGEV